MQRDVLRFLVQRYYKKATGKMHYTYNEKLFFRKKAYLCTRIRK